MTDTQKPRKKKLTTAERVAALQRGEFAAPVRLTREAAIRTKGKRGVNKNLVAKVTKEVVEAAEQAQAASVAPAPAPEPVSVPKAPLVLAVQHATSLIRTKKRSPGHACTIAADLFNLDAADVLAAYEESLPKSVPVHAEADDDDEWDEDDEDDNVRDL